MKKKLLFFAMFGVMTMSLMSFAKELQAVWTSTCGVKHYTTFPSNYTYQQMSDYIAAVNYIECGTKPSVSLNLN